jgi:hypothetical protein
VLTKDDHPTFLSRPSFVDYALIKHLFARHFISDRDRGIIVPRPKFPPSVFQRIVDGVQVSPRISLDMKKHFAIRDEAYESSQNRRK